MIRYGILVSLYLLLLLGRARPCTAQASASAPDPLLAARTKGSASAPVTVYEMSDFQCPYCRRHAVETFPELEHRYIDTGMIRWVFINFPLSQIHPNAVAAAEFAMCGAKAGHFWPIHDLIYRYQGKWAPLKEPGPFLLTLADSIGWSRDSALSCLAKGDMRAVVRADAEGASRSGAISTPTFYIEGGLLEGAAPLPDFVHILDSIYAAKTAGVKR
jgi:protein-disulfide isomerase